MLTVTAARVCWFDYYFFLTLDAVDSIEHCHV